MNIGSVTIFKNKQKKTSYKTKYSRVPSAPQVPGRKKVSRYLKTKILRKVSFLEVFCSY